MLSINLNEFVLIQITQAGWEYLLDTFGKKYVDNCIHPNSHIVDGVIYYKFHLHEVATVFGRAKWISNPPITMNILILNSK
jgi:hypothetical protein